MGVTVERLAHNLLDGPVAAFVRMKELRLRLSV